MNDKVAWSRILVALGGVAILIGAVDPLEGSVIILAGSGMIALGTVLGGGGRTKRLFWLWMLGLVAVGVSALWGLSAIGGIGEGSGHSMWWGLLILPYPAAWIMIFVGLILRLIDFVKGRGVGGQGVSPSSV